MSALFDAGKAKDDQASHFTGGGLPQYDLEMAYLQKLTMANTAWDRYLGREISRVKEELKDVDLSHKGLDPQHILYGSVSMENIQAASVSASARDEQKIRCKCVGIFNRLSFERLKELRSELSAAMEESKNGKNFDSQNLVAYVSDNPELTNIISSALDCVLECKQMDYQKEPDIYLKNCDKVLKGLRDFELNLIPVFERFLSESQKITVEDKENDGFWGRILKSKKEDKNKFENYQKHVLGDLKNDLIRVYHDAFARGNVVLENLTRKIKIDSGKDFDLKVLFTLNFDDVKVSGDECIRQNNVFDLDLGRLEDAFVYVSHREKHGNGLKKKVDFDEISNFWRVDVMRDLLNSDQLPAVDFATNLIYLLKKYKLSDWGAVISFSARFAYMNNNPVISQNLPIYKRLKEEQLAKMKAAK
ncbi:MAG TPA: hypothetical protein PLB38_03025 [bacterium]|mgnify:CR=1 FL=1|nr:hypothetical protein [bacterium]